ncbi:putative quinol monooxygenase [Streptomyces filamentosus]|uniref:putative quinol monooxygenase n=1 Tax=Streptomyces filamentosus TaxID=67294 RepID=UPI0037F8E96E
MFHIAVAFDVPAERRAEFVAAALVDGRDSLADEPGTRRFELIADSADPGRFYLNEAYEDEAAFDAHCAGEHFARFFAAVEEYAEGPTWLIRGTRVDEHAVAAG